MREAVQSTNEAHRDVEVVVPISDRDEASPPPLRCRVLFSVARGLTILFRRGESRESTRAINKEEEADCAYRRDEAQLELQDRHPSVTFDLPAYALGIAVIGTLWLLMWSALPSSWMAPGSGTPVFDPLAAIVFSTFFGKAVCKVLQLPALVGIIWFAILWAHIYHTGYLVSGIPSIVTFLVGRIGLTTILVRAGFALSWDVVRPVLFNAIALSLLPLSIESIVHAVVARYIFYDEFDGGDWQWAFLQGFLCSVVSAAITVPGTIALQAEGYQRGVPPLILSSVGLDTATGVWVVSFILSLIFNSGSQSLGLKIALGPIQLAGGVFLGVVIGIGFNLIITRIAIPSLVEPKALRTALRTPSHQAPHGLEALDRYVMAAFMLVALASVFFGNQVSLAGGGTILAITFGATVSHLWGYRMKQLNKQLQRPSQSLSEEAANEPTANATVPVTDGDSVEMLETNGTPDELDEQPAGTELAAPEVCMQAPEVCRNRFVTALKARLGGNLATLWDVIVLGPLFTMSGVRVKLVDIFAADFFWKGVVVFICAAAVRMIVSSACGFKLGLTRKEYAFIGLGWLGKASVQAAMGGIALQQASDALDLEQSRLVALNATATLTGIASLASLERRVTAAQTVQNTSVLFILISAPLCAIFITKLGPTMLEKGAPSK